MCEVLEVIVDSDTSVHRIIKPLVQSPTIVDNCLVYKIKKE